ncbi:BspA family leucine-rich repeat surface protein, partial [Enterococcus hirae]
MKSKKRYAYLFASTILLINVVVTPMTIIAETLQETSSTEVVGSKKNQEEAQEMPVTNSEKVEERQSKEETPVTPEETPVVENEEKASEGVTNAVGETDGGTTTNQEVRLADWDIQDRGSYIYINRYMGSDPNVIVPNEINNKPVEIRTIKRDFFENLDPKALRSFRVLPREDGTKVGLGDRNLDRVFYECSALQTVDLTGLDTSQVTRMDYMFYNCSALQTVDLTGLDTSQVTRMDYMFHNCSALQTVDLTGLDTSQVTRMDYMFHNCSSLQSLDVSNFNTSKVTNMSYMFRGCSSLQSLDLSSFDTSQVTRMDYMFYNCSSLQSLDVSNFNTSKVTNMSYMFRGCSSLQSLDLSNFNTNQVTNMRGMLANCSALRFANLFNFNTQLTPQSYLTSMFENDEILAISKDIWLPSKEYNRLYKHYDTSPLSTPSLDANGGQFADGTATKKYFDKIVYNPSVFDRLNELANFEQFKRENIPTKEGSKFLGWKVTQGNDTNATNVIPDLLGTVYQAQWANSSVTVKYVFEGTGNEIHETKEIFGNTGERYDATT